MHDDDHGRGLAHDLKTLAAQKADRRQVLRWLAVASVAPILGCGDDAETTSSSSTTGAGGSTASSASSTTASTGSGTCSTIPEETAGPFPANGSMGTNALVLSGIVRSDITSSIGAASGVAEGVPLTVTLTLVNSNGGCAPLAGYAIYLWHCDRDGAYSMYSGTASGENYLRGVQETDSDGTVTFTTIFPGAYDGRWPHMHFEMYPSLASATDDANKVATSQLALPEPACDEAYTAAGYETSVVNLAKGTLASDNVFSDGYSLQVADVTGSVAGGFAATLTVAIAE